MCILCLTQGTDGGFNVMLFAEQFFFIWGRMPP